VVWALLFFALIPGGGLGDDQEKFTIEGNVVNAVTGEPLRRAAIAMQGARSQENNASLNTDAGGRFVLTGLPAGIYTLSAEKQGFSHTAPVPVEVGPSKLDITIKLMPFGRIAGKVVDDLGDPILNANIQLFRSTVQGGRRVIQPAGTGMTNDLGEFHVASLPGGRYFVSATAQPEADGTAYARTFYGGGHDIGAASPIELQAGGSERVEIRMQAVRSYAVRGTIVNLPEGLHPYLNIARRGSVLAATEAHATRVYPATGAFEFSGVTPGDWIVTAGCFEKSTQLFGTAEVVVSDSDSAGLTISLGAATELKGAIHFDNSAFNPKQVYLAFRPASDGSQGAMGVQVNDDGTFTVQGIQPGDYTLAARVPEPWYIQSAQMAGVDILNGSFSVNGAGAAGPIDIVVSNGGGQIQGTVVEGSGPVTSAAVLLMGPGPARIAQLDPLGKFYFKSLAPGDYRVYAFTEVQDVEYTNPDVMQRFSSERINVTEGGKQQIELKLNRPPF
jgi:hypothetical protein